MPVALIAWEGPANTGWLHMPQIQQPPSCISNAQSMQNVESPCVQIPGRLLSFGGSATVKINGEMKMWLVCQENGHPNILYSSEFWGIGTRQIGVSFLPYGWSGPCWVQYGIINMGGNGPNGTTVPTSPTGGVEFQINLYSEYR